MGASCVRPTNKNSKLDPNGHRYMTDEEYYNLNVIEKS